MAARAGQTVLGWPQPCPASRAHPLGGGCGARPRCVRVLSITGLSKMAAMFFSSTAPQFGHRARLLAVGIRLGWPGLPHLLD